MKLLRGLKATFLALTLSTGLVACGSGEVYVGTTVAATPDTVAYLDLVPTRIGPRTVQLDWSYDPVAYSYLVRRDGYQLAYVPGTTVIDDSGVFGERYCYDVLGLSASGRVISQSPLACISLF